MRAESVGTPPAPRRSLGKLVELDAWRLLIQLRRADGAPLGRVPELVHELVLRDERT